MKKIILCLFIALLMSSCAVNRSENPSNETRVTPEDVSTITSTPEANASAAPPPTSSEPIPSETAVTPSTEPPLPSYQFSDGSFNENDILKLLTMTKDQIEARIGTEYEVSLTGAEESYTAYTYKKHDISLFYTDGDNVDFIDCGATVIFAGLKIGMTFSEVKAIFPTAGINKWSPEADESVAYYNIEIVLDNVSVLMSMKDEGGPTTSLEIFRN